MKTRNLSTFATNTHDTCGTRNEHVEVAEEGVVPSEAELAEAGFEAAVRQIDVDALVLIAAIF